MATRLIIDGYNLVHVTGIVGPESLPGTLERSRNGLLQFLAQAIDEPTRAGTTIVFDAMNAPPGLPRSFVFRDMTILFAPRSEDADTLIENLIQAHHSPRQLTVVSSDHRIQRAARRRRAVPTDSDRWYAAMERQRRTNPASQQVKDVKPRSPLSSAEVQSWLDEFGVVDINEEEVKPVASEETRNDSDDIPRHDTQWEGFPPGYCDDLLPPDDER